jgi:DNA-binding transcriptional LysR family regulator
VRWLADVIASPNTVFTSNSAIAQYHAAVAGVGIALLPSFLAARDERLKPLLVGDVSVTRDLWLSTHHGVSENPRVRAVIEFMTSTVAEDQDYLLGRVA